MKWYWYILAPLGGWLLVRMLLHPAEASVAPAPAPTPGPPLPGPTPVEPAPPAPATVTLPTDEWSLLAWAKQQLCDEGALINVVKQVDVNTGRPSYLLYWKLSAAPPGAASLEGRFSTEVPVTGNVFTRLAQEVLVETKGAACGLRTLTGSTHGPG